MISTCEPLDASGNRLYIRLFVGNVIGKIKFERKNYFLTWRTRSISTILLWWLSYPLHLLLKTDQTRSQIFNLFQHFILEKESYWERPSTQDHSASTLMWQFIIVASVHFQYLFAHRLLFEVPHFERVTCLSSPKLCSTSFSSSGNRGVFWDFWKKGFSWSIQDPVWFYPVTVQSDYHSEYLCQLYNQLLEDQHCCYIHGWGLHYCLTGSEWVYLAGFEATSARSPEWLFCKSSYCIPYLLPSHSPSVGCL